MRPSSVAHIASICSTSSAIRAPPLKRLLVYWPRYLQVRGHGSIRTDTSGSTRNVLREKKAYSTNTDCVIPLSGIVDSVVFSNEHNSDATNSSTHAKVDDNRYYDPQEYLEEYGEELSEDTVQQWRADIKAHPPEYAMREYDAWLLEVGKSPSVQILRNSLEGDEESEQTRVIGRRYQTRSEWKSAFLRLYAQFDERIKPELRNPAFLGDSRASEWAQPFLNAEPEARKSLWLNLDGWVATRIWPHVMLHVLHKHPEKALSMLSDSLVVTRQESAVEVVFSFVIRYAATFEGPARRAWFGKLLAFLLTSLRPDHIADSKTFGYCILTLQREQKSHRIPKLYRNLTERGFPLPCWSHLHFAYSLAKSGHLSQALDGLEASVDPATKILDAKKFLNSGAFRSVCVDIVRKLVNAKDGYRTSLDVVDRLMQMGYRLNTASTNVLMLSALEAGDTATCMWLYDSMAQNAVGRNSVTYDFALRALRNSTDNDRIQAVVNEALDYREEGEYYVQNAVLRCLGPLYQEQSPDTAFERLLSVYQQRFDLSPLSKLGITPSSSGRGAPQVDQPDCLVHPDKATVHTMLHYFLATRENSRKRVWTIWQNFKQLMQTDSFYASCGESAYFYSTFLFRLGRHKKGLKHCIVILNDMLRKSTTNGDDHHFSRTRSSNIHLAPNTTNMNILLEAFLHHHKHEAANKLQALMSEYGIPRDVVTYNTLIAAYAKEQDTERAAHFLKEMERTGYEANEYTIRAIKAFADQSALKDALERNSELD